MFTPIVIRRRFLTLAEFPPPRKKEKYPRAPLTDAEPLRHELGVHEECGEPLYFFRVGGTHGLIACISCGIRIVVPKTVRTYGDLRSHAAETEQTP